MFQQLTLGNGGLMDSAHLLQQILFISAVLEAETFTYRRGKQHSNVKFGAWQESLRRVHEILITTHLTVFSIKPDIDRLPAELQYFIMKTSLLSSILPSNHLSHSLLTS